MKKRVNVNTYGRVIAGGLPVPIRGNIDDVMLEVDHIEKIIFAKGQVTEILKNGQTIPLNLNNYNKDNNKELVKAEQQKQKAENDARLEQERQRRLEEEKRKAEQEAKEKAAREQALKEEQERQKRIEEQKKAEEEAAKKQQQTQQQSKK